jgi:hypothetical protein
MFDRFHINRKPGVPKDAANRFSLTAACMFPVFNNAVKNNVEKSRVTRVTLRQICVFSLCTESGANINIA